MGKSVKVKILEMEQGEFDVYNFSPQLDEPKFMSSVEPEDLPNYLSGLRLLHEIPSNNVEIILSTYKSFNLMFAAHVAADNESCDCLYGGVYEPPADDCAVCDQRAADVFDYYKSVGVKQIL